MVMFLLTILDISKRHALYWFWIEFQLKTSIWIGIGLNIISFNCTCLQKFPMLKNFAKILNWAFDFIIFFHDFPQQRWKFRIWSKNQLHQIISCIETPIFLCFSPTPFQLLEAKCSQHLLNYPGWSCRWNLHVRPCMQRNFLRNSGFQALCIAVSNRRSVQNTSSSKNMPTTWKILTKS